MAKMIDILSKSDVEKLSTSAYTAIVDLGISGETRGVSEDAKFGISSLVPSHRELSIPILKFVHALLLDEAHPPLGKLPRPYVKVFDGQFRGLILRAFSGFLTKNQADYLGASIMIIFAKNKLAIRSKKRGAIFVAPWSPPNLDIRFHGHQDYLTKRDEWQMEKREHEETSRPTTQVVNVTYDLRLIPTPEKSDPESILLYVKQLVTAFNRLKDAHTELMKQHKEVLEELETATKSATPVWENVASEIASIIESEVDS